MSKFNERLLSIAREKVKSLIDSYLTGSQKTRVSVLRALGYEIAVVSDPEGAKSVLVDDQDHYEKGIVNRAAIDPLLGRGLFTIEGDHWKAHRAIIAPVFTRRTTERARETMRRSAARFLESHPGGEVDVAKLTAEMVAPALCRSVLGCSMPDYKSHMDKVFDGYDKIAIPVIASRMVGAPASMDGGYQNKQEAFKKKLNLIADLILDAPDDDIDEGLMLERMRKAVDAGAMSREGMRDEVLTTLASILTTGTAIAWSCYLLAVHRDIQEKLHAEIDAGEGRSYADMVRDETLRLYPPIHTLTRQSKCPVHVLGNSLKAGALMVVSPLVIHRNPDVWNDPDTFDPERFRGGRPTGKRRLAFLPFSAGRRFCIGSSVASVMITEAIHGIAERFDLAPVPGATVRAQRRIRLIPAENKLPLLMTRRVRGAAPDPQ